MLLMREMLQTAGKKGTDDRFHISVGQRDFAQWSGKGIHFT
jgi:hypothetical protein